MKVKLFIFLIVFIPLVGCKKHCATFNDEYLPWIAFQNTNNLIYKNQFSDTLVFNPYSVVKSESYIAGSPQSEPCLSYAIVETQNTSNAEYRIICTINIIRDNLQFSVGVSFSNSLDINNHDIEKWGRFEFTSPKINEDVQTITINGVDYSDALVMSIDTTQQGYPALWKCIVVKGHGLKQFYERKGVVWTLVEE